MGRQSQAVSRPSTDQDFVHADAMVCIALRHDAHPLPAAYVFKNAALSSRDVLRAPLPQSDHGRHEVMTGGR